jgi:rhamnosyltransferase
MPSRPRDTDVVAPPLENGICAIVVTYGPGPEVPANLDAILRQVQRLIIVDNEVTAASRERLGPFASHPAVECFFNQENLGIAAALNQGVERALAGGFAWIATFDQDSRVPEGYMDALRAAHAGYPGREKVAVLAPLYRDRSLGFVYSASGPVAEDSGGNVPVSVAATSGNLVSAEALRRVGGFRGDFFIDCVDFEFCLRCRRAGWQVLEVRGVKLDHAQGHWYQRRFLWKNPRVNDYGAVRRYYQARNRLIVFAGFIGFDSRWVLRDAWGYGSDSLKLLLFGQDRWIKVQAMATGCWHALTGRRGRWQPGRRFTSGFPRPPASG